jgi:hypothetical protein
VSERIEEYVRRRSFRCRRRERWREDIMAERQTTQLSNRANVVDEVFTDDNTAVLNEVLLGRGISPDRITTIFRDPDRRW